MRILLFVLLLLISACGEKSNKAKVSFSKLGFFAASDSYKGGVKIWGIESGKNLSFSTSMTGESEQRMVEIPIGTWSFYAIGWSGGTGPYYPYEGDVKCGVATKSIMAADEGVNITLAPTSCGAEFSMLSYMSGSSFLPLKLISCHSLILPSAVAADSDCATRAGSAVAFKVAMPDFTSGSIRANAANRPSSSFQLMSKCYPVTASETTTYLSIPVGNNGTGTPFPVGIQSYSDSSCTTAIDSYYFSNGLLSGASFDGFLKDNADIFYGSGYTQIFLGEGVGAAGGGCPMGYVYINANPALGTQQDFCVAKYEMKNVLASPVSKPDGIPWVGISAADAYTECGTLGAGYALINNAEWMTVARSIEQTPINWLGSVIGTNYIYSGHNDNDPALPLAASADDNNLTYGTGTSPQQRIHKVGPDMKAIWDFAGNVAEWVDWNGGDGAFTAFNTTSCNSMPSYTEISLAINMPVCAITTNYLALAPSNLAWSSSNGIGKIKSSSSASSFPIKRGGNYQDVVAAGIYTFDSLSSTADSSTGFRCVYHPTPIVNDGQSVTTQTNNGIGYGVFWPASGTLDNNGNVWIAGSDVSTGYIKRIDKTFQADMNITWTPAITSLNDIFIDDLGRVIAIAEDGTSNAYVKRYYSSGVLDTSFGSSGTAVISGSGTITINAVIIDRQRNIVVVGEDSTGANIWKFREDGSFVNFLSFGAGTSANDLIQLPAHSIYSGKYLVVGQNGVLGRIWTVNEDLSSSPYSPTLGVNSSLNEVVNTRDGYFVVGEKQSTNMEGVIWKLKEISCGGSGICYETTGWGTSGLRVFSNDIASNFIGTGITYYAGDLYVSGYKETLAHEAIIAKVNASTGSIVTSFGINSDGARMFGNAIDDFIGVDVIVTGNGSMVGLGMQGDIASPSSVKIWSIK